MRGKTLELAGSGTGLGAPAAVRAAGGSVYSGHGEAHTSPNVHGQTGKTLQPHPKKANRDLDLEKLFKS